MGLQLSPSCLLEWLNITEISDQEVTEWSSELTQMGLECEVVHSKPLFENVIVGRITAVNAHPNADRLNICQVDVGSQSLSIVCGCSTVAVGQTVVVAVVGARLPEFKIKRSKIRGVESEGMLCSPKELGYGLPSSGIWQLNESIQPGTLFADLVQLNTTFLELDVTPNRGDWLSSRGVARELSLIKKLNCHWQEKQCQVKLHQWGGYPVNIVASDDCPVYCMASVSGIGCSYDQMPLWLIERMRELSIHMVHPIVDLLNYVAIEYGQPMHAFDHNNLSGTVEIRRALDNEKIELLNGEICQLTSEMLIIADNNGPLALAGVMGGADSAVSESTQTILIESAHFDPNRIAKACRHYRYTSDAAYRFERGVDSDLPAIALKRAIELIQICFPDSHVSDIQTTSVKNRDAEKPVITLSHKRIEGYLGDSVTVEEVSDSLAKIGQYTFCDRNQQWSVTQPSHRHDLVHEVNWISEVIRLRGYDRLLSKTPDLPLSLEAQSFHWSMPFICGEYLRSIGYNELLSFTFVDRASQKNITGHDDTAVALLNPMSQTGDVLRQTLCLGLLKAAQYNIQRQKDAFKIFEWGNAYTKSAAGVIQSDRLISGLSVGKSSEDSWCYQSREVDFFDIKGHVIGLLDRFGLAVDAVFETSDLALLHPYQQANVIVCDRKIGSVGMLHPELSKQFDLPTAVGLFELDYTLIKPDAFKRVNNTSKYPSVKRDLSFWISEDITYHDIKKAILSLGIKSYKKMDLFDVYYDKEHEAAVSLSISIWFQHPDKTLSEKEIIKYMNNILDRLERDFNIQLRGGIHGYSH